MVFVPVHMGLPWQYEMFLSGDYPIPETTTARKVASPNRSELLPFLREEAFDRLKHRLHPITEKFQNGEIDDRPIDYVYQRFAAPIHPWERHSRTAYKSDLSSTRPERQGGSISNILAGLFENRGFKPNASKQRSRTAMNYFKKTSDDLLKALTMNARLSTARVRTIVISTANETPDSPKTQLREKSGSHSFLFSYPGLLSCALRLNW